MNEKFFNRLLKIYTKTHTKPPMTYPLQWLDEVVNITLNPAETDIHLITAVQAAFIGGKANEEIRRNITFLQSLLFSFAGRQQMKQLIGRYHFMVILLINRQAENIQQASLKDPCLQKQYHKVLSCLERLQSFIETRAGTYLSLKEQVPAAYLSLTKTALAKKVTKLKKDLAPQITNQQLSALLFQALHNFINGTSWERSITYRDVFYMQLFVKKLEQLKTPEKVKFTYTVLDELLIYLNFNYPPYLDYFTEHLAENSQTAGNVREKLDFLLYYHKSFKQLHCRPHTVYNPDCRDLKDVLNNWFRQEIRYLKQKLRLSANAPQTKQEGVIIKPKQEYSRQKITCQLSSDQMALIIRSLDDLRIISARSLNDVFRNIVPHLSTPHKQELSFEAMRSKSYIVETKDQQKVVEVLQEILEKIKKY